MSQATQSVRRITDDVLFIGKVESGAFMLVFAPLVIQEAVESALAELRDLAISREVTVSFEIAPDVPKLVLGVGTQLKIVLSSLLSNGWYGICMHLSTCTTITRHCSISQRLAMWLIK